MASSSSNANQKVVPVPKEFQAIENILMDMGVQDVEPGVVMSLYNLVYFYVTANLDDAQIYAQHAKRKQIEVDDIKLAMKMNSDKMFTNPPPRELMMELARTLNSRSLPSITSLSGPRLPPDRCCLTAPNYSLKAYKKPSSSGGSGPGFPYTPLAPAMGAAARGSFMPHPAAPGSAHITGNYQSNRSAAGVVGMSGGGGGMMRPSTSGNVSTHPLHQHQQQPYRGAMDDGGSERFLPAAGIKRPFDN